MTMDLFEQADKEEFIKSVKTGKERQKEILNNGMSLTEAFRFGYLDVARAPLRGIGKILKEGSNITRENCIKKIVLFLQRVLVFCKSQSEFDDKHRELCEEISNYYADEGYSVFTVGKAQKWINMGLKYACIYNNEEDRLCNIIGYCHVPIDRYMAYHIDRELNVTLPEYQGFKKPRAGWADRKSCDYAWSKIESYDEYLTCQKRIREVLDKQRSGKCPLEWEFQVWINEKRKDKRISS